MVQSSFVLCTKAYAYFLQQIYIILQSKHIFITTQLNKTLPTRRQVTAWGFSLLFLLSCFVTVVLIGNPQSIDLLMLEIFFFLPFEAQISFFGDFQGGSRLNQVFYEEGENKNSRYLYHVSRISLWCQFTPMQCRLPSNIWPALTEQWSSKFLNFCFS